MHKDVALSIVIALIVLASIAIPMIGAQVTVTTTPARYRFANNATITVYYVPALAEYEGPMAVFMRDGVLYVAYDNYDNGSNIMRLDTGEIVKVCSFSDYIEFEAIVGGNGTAYGIMYYYNDTTYESGDKIIDLWDCKVIAKIGSDSYSIQAAYDTWGNALVKYDPYHNRLVFVYLNATCCPIINTYNVTVIDPATGNVRHVFGIAKNTNTGFVNSVLVTSDYLYVIVANVSTGMPISMYVFDARNLSLVKIMKSLPTCLPTQGGCYLWQGSALLDYNRFGILYLKPIGNRTKTTPVGGYTITYTAFINRITLCDYGFSCTEYATDLEKNPGQHTGVVAYKDVFVVHGGESPYLTAAIRIIPYVHIFLPDKGLLINTSIAGFAIPVDYNLWRSNKIVVFNPHSHIYVIDPPVTTVTETQTMIQTVTQTVTTTSTITTTVPTTITTTETVASSATTTNTITTAVTTTATPYPPSNTTTVTTTITTTTTETVTTTATSTTTVIPYPSATSSWLLPLILLLIILAITGIIKMATKSIIAQKTTFVKKK